MNVKTRLPIALATVFIAALVYVGTTWAAFNAETEAPVVSVTGGTYSMEARLSQSKDVQSDYKALTLNSDNPLKENVKTSIPQDAFKDKKNTGKPQAELYLTLTASAEGTGLSYFINTKQNYYLDFQKIAPDQTPGEPTDSISGYLKAGETQQYLVTLTRKKTTDTGNLSIFLNTYTAAGNTAIRTAGSIEQLNALETIAPGTVVYLTGDISAPEQALTFNGAMPTINLMGHTLNVKSITVNADAAYDGQAIISNGKLIVNNTSYGKGEQLPVTLSAGAKLAIQLVSLTKEEQPTAPAEPTAPAATPEAPAAPETGDPVTEPDTPAEEPVVTPEPETPAEPQAPDTPSDAGTADTPQPSVETDTAAPVV